MLFMFAGDQEFDEINLMIAQFQNTMMRARFSSVPVVVAPHNMALGGDVNFHSMPTTFKHMPSYTWVWWK